MTTIIRYDGQIPIQQTFWFELCGVFYYGFETEFIVETSRPLKKCLYKILIAKFCECELQECESLEKIVVSLYDSCKYHLIGIINLALKVRDKEIENLKDELKLSKEFEQNTLEHISSYEKLVPKNEMGNDLR